MATETTQPQPSPLRKTSFEGQWEERDTPQEGQFGHYPQLPFDWSKNFHVYALEWEEERLTWYLDGQKLWMYEGPTPQKEMQLLLGQYQLGGNPKFAGWLNPTPDNLPYPRDFEIDYVRVYTRDVNR